MGDRYYAAITFGGCIGIDKFDDLVELVVDMEFEDTNLISIPTVDQIKSVERNFSRIDDIKKAAYLNAISGKTPAWFSDSEASNGVFEELEGFLREADCTYRRLTSGYFEYPPYISYYSPEDGELVVDCIGDGWDPAVLVSVLEGFTSMYELRQHIESMNKGARGHIPAFTLQKDRNESHLLLPTDGKPSVCMIELERIFKKLEKVKPL